MVNAEANNNMQLDPIETIEHLKGVEDENGLVGLMYDYLRDNDYSKVVDLDSQEGLGNFEVQRFFCRQNAIER